MGCADIKAAYRKIVPYGAALNESQPAQQLYSCFLHLLSRLADLGPLLALTVLIALTVRPLAQSSSCESTTVKVESAGCLVRVCCALISRLHFSMQINLLVFQVQR